MSEKKPVKMETVKLKAGHTHAGKAYPVGAELTLPAHDAAYLRRLGKIA